MTFFDKEGYALPILLAILLHATIIIFSVAGFHFVPEKKREVNERPIVQAKVVDIDKTIIGQRIRDEKKRAADARAAKKKAEERKKALEEQKVLAERQRKIDAARKAKEAEEAKRAAEKKALLEKQKKERLAKEKARRLAEEAAKKEEAQKKLEAERIAQKNKEDEARKREEARIAEEKRIRQEEARKTLERERKLAEQKAAQKEIEAEAQKQREAEEQQAVQSLVDLIIVRISRNWIRPPSARNGMIAELNISFLPNGEVNEVFITQSSGDVNFDNNVKNAVHKVDRIEELADLDSYIFERNFRSVEIIFNPQDLRN
ncbi:cell envelope integrity protein TolA [Marinomonas agarivorans]|nr:cell envelope integrity protein TolA [Marinomonas agarivorans]